MFLANGLGTTSIQSDYMSDKSVEEIVGKKAQAKQEKQDPKPQPQEDIQKIAESKQLQTIALFSHPYIDTWGTINNKGNMILIPYDFSRRAQGVLILSPNAKDELAKILAAGDE